LEFNPQSCTFIAPNSNSDTIVVDLGKIQLSIGPGSSMKPVLVDVKPGSNPATINLKNEHTIAIAILGTSDFDVNLIDNSLSSIRFGHSLTATPALATKVSTGDVNGDGLTDLIVHFRTSQTGLVVGDATGCIVGKLKQSAGGASIAGCDSIRLIKG
jgi:hypothetical protein